VRKGHGTADTTTATTVAATAITTTATAAVTAATATSEGASSTADSKIDTSDDEDCALGVSDATTEDVTSPEEMLESNGAKQQIPEQSE
jgi:hypothetical protein